MFLSTETKEKTMMRDSMLIFPILGDGACLYNALAAFLYEDQKQSANLRRMAHQFIVMHWWYWKQYIPLPFTEQVGVGSRKVLITKVTEKELHEFLLSDESLLMWSTHTDIAVLANMCNMTISTFTYNVPNQPHCLRTTPPDPYLTHYSALDASAARDVALYNSNNSHYDLLVTPDSGLALLGTVFSNLPQEEDVITLEEDLVASSCLRRAEPHLKDVPSVSPMTFMPCPKGPGRPKGGRQGAA